MIYTPAGGQPAVLLGVTDPLDAGTARLLAFDPNSGNVVATPTGLTTPVTISRQVSNGVLYVGGLVTLNAPTLPQVFGIRVDEAVQGLRDFVVESQLMQDFDPAPADRGGLARYQTHLTLLDDTRAPLPNTPVKVWADAPTALLLNGQLHQVGPGDAECAVTQSGPDGVVTLVSGAVAPGGADRPNVSAVPLRVWAPFMDPYERMVVFPDREFHNRLATAHATTTGDPAYDDPDRINLQTATNYAG